MTDISYESLVEKALLNVVRDALDYAAQNGLGDANHFYISFKTQHPDVVLSDRMKASYPDEMTIVLQHEFSHLDIGDNGFSVTLSFGNIPERITVPFAAITRFADPYAQFGLSFKPEVATAPKPKKKEKTEKPAKDEKSENVVSLSAFRKKK